MSNSHLQNIVGKTLKRLRRGQKLSQEMLAARCAVIGWDISQNTITKIESGFRCVSDYELLTLSRALRTNVNQLFQDGTDIQAFHQDKAADRKDRLYKKASDAISE